MDLTKLKKQFQLELFQKFECPIKSGPEKHRLALMYAMSKVTDIMTTILLELEAEQGPFYDKRDVILRLSDLAAVQSGEMEYEPGEAPVWYTRRAQKMPAFQKRFIKGY